MNRSIILLGVSENISRSLTLFLLLLALLLIFLSHVFSNNNSALGYSITAEENFTSNIPIKHIIVIIQGRHSFDNYFGTFPNASGFPAGVKVPADPFNLNTSLFIQPFYFESGQRYKPRDDPQAYRLSYNNGSMNGFIFANRDDHSKGRNVMGYYDDRDIPYYWKFASEYVLAQRFFAPSMRSDLVNSLYAIGADPLPYLQMVPEKGLHINKTIFDVLQANKIPWKVYIENYGSVNNMSSEERSRLFSNIPLLAMPRFTDNQSMSSHLDDLGNYYRDLRYNNLAAVNYLYFIESDDSVSTNVVAAQELVGTLVYSLMKSEYWNNSAVIITHNEAGSWFDHVKPPINNRTNELNGFRVPAIFISAYAKKSYIDNSTYDISSVLRFIESSFAIRVLPERDNKTSNVMQAFDFTKPPRDPLYLEEIASEIILTRFNDVHGVNILYVLSLGIPGVVTIYWYFKKLNFKTRRC